MVTDVNASTAWPWPHDDSRARQSAMILELDHGHPYGCPLSVLRAAASRPCCSIMAKASRHESGDTHFSPARMDRMTMRSRELIRARLNH